MNPIERIEWVETKDLVANSYNPNVVYNKELDLLAHSIIKNGWIQPILITQDNIIIDGFHRYSLAINHKGVREYSNGLVPCVRMELTEAERMFLTIRINRAKGSHIAVKMHEIIVSLVEDHGISLKQVCKEIGATKAEVELLLQDDVFKKLDIQNHKYSKAWYPK
jgi:ParB-like chromosome segregation protein Spo0J